MEKIQNQQRFFTMILVLGLFFSMLAQENNVGPLGISSKLINVNPDPNGEPWIAGGLSADEEQAMMSAPELTLDKAYHGSSALPGKVDNSVSVAFRPVFNQVGGSCAQASTVGYIFTYEIDYLRGLSASSTDAQYPYGYTYSFVNSGSSANGSNTNQGWSIIQYNGVPSIADYGSITGNTSTTLWMSGYDKYYRGMANRTISQFTIGVTADSGMQKMKQWLHNHGDGQSQGGCLVFAAQATGWKLKKLPSASPSAGYPCLISMGTTGGHAMTIAGYNDSIFYDIDSNGVISDNERGGVLMVNSWGSSFGSAGKSYVMYDVLRRTGAGKIDGNRVMGVKVAKTNAVKMAFKVNITHDTRNLLKITSGLNTNTGATSPSGTPIGFSFAFNYCGGALPLAGSAGSATLEIGLDVTHLVTAMGTAKNAKLFLILASKGGNGKVNSFSVMDYRGASAIEIPCSQSNITITPGTSSAAATTYLSVNLSASVAAKPYATSDAAPRLSLSYCNSHLYYSVPRAGLGAGEAVLVKVFDAHGKLVRTLAGQPTGVGHFSFNLAAPRLVSGVYLCTLDAGSHSTSIPIIVN